MKPRIVLISVLLAGALVVTACSSSSQDSTDTTVASGGGATTTNAGDGSGGTDTTTGPDTTVAPDTTTTTTDQEPAIGGVDLIDQVTPTSGGGTRPLLEWGTVDGAALYFVTIYTETGGSYWAAVTEETSTYVGGPLQIPAGRTGPNVAEGYTWVVYAEDGDGNLLAASPKRTIAP